MRRAGRLAAGWVSSSRARLSDIERGARVVREAAAEAGKNPDDVRIVVRAVVQPGDRNEAITLSGSWADIRAGARRYAEAGATELFYEPNWDPRIGGPDADPEVAARLGTEMIEALAPGESV